MVQSGVPLKRSFSGFRRAFLFYGGTLYSPFLRGIVCRVLAVDVASGATLLIDGLWNDLLGIIDFVARMFDPFLNWVEWEWDRKCFVRTERLMVGCERGWR